ncbi:MAG: LptA/OstA family protein [Gammaproteobacteria bacterium]
MQLSTGYRVCRNMSIASVDGRITISAGEASSEDGAGFEQHTWKLIDGVRLTFDDARISADSAELSFAANELISADIQGSPVELSDFIEESGTEFHASTDRLTYDSASDTLRIPGQASFETGDESGTGCNLIYNPQRRLLSVGTTDADCSAELRFATPARDAPPEPIGSVEDP